MDKEFQEALISAIDELLESKQHFDTDMEVVGNLMNDALNDEGILSVTRKGHRLAWDVNEEGEEVLTIHKMRPKELEL